MKAIFHCEADRAEVMVYGDIGDSWGDGVEAKPFIDDLGEIRASTVTVRINSPGGDVFDAVAMYHALIRHPARIEVEVDALAASAASVLAMAGDQIQIADGAFLMIHNPWTMAIGDAAEFRRMADTLDRVESSIASMYSARSELTQDGVLAAMTAETWYSASEAVEAGLADAIGAPLKVAASIDKRRFKAVPDALAAQATEPDNPPPPCHWRRAYAERVLTMANELA